MDVAELLAQPQKNHLVKIPRIIKHIQFVCRLIALLIQQRDDEKMLAGFSRTQLKLGEQEIFQISWESIDTADDMEALVEYLVPRYQSGISARYNPLLQQAVSEDISWFIYPLFLEVWSKHGATPDRVIKIFQDSTQTLNLLGKDTHFNQMHDKDSPIFLVGDKIEATEELKKLKVGQVGGCPLMRVKSAVQGTLMTDFIVTCVRFWCYRKVIAIQKD